MAHVSKHRNASIESQAKLVRTVTSEKMEEKKLEEIAAATASSARAVASARGTLSARLMAKEQAKGDAAKEQAERLCVSARRIVNSEETKAEQSIAKVEAKWADLIEQRIKLETAEALREKKAAEEQERAVKRKADQQEAAQHLQSAFQEFAENPRQRQKQSALLEQLADTVHTVLQQRGGALLDQQARAATLRGRALLCGKQPGEKLTEGEKREMEDHLAEVEHCLGTETGDGRAKRALMTRLRKAKSTWRSRPFQRGDQRVNNWRQNGDQMG